MGDTPTGIVAVALEVFFAAPVTTPEEEFMSTITLTADDFEKTILEPPESSSGIVLVDFRASGRGPCRTFAPTYEAASKRHPEGSRR